MNFQEVTEIYYRQKGKQATGDNLGFLQAVHTSLLPMFNRPATPENMFDAQVVAIRAYTQHLSDSTKSVLFKSALGALSGGLSPVIDSIRSKTLIDFQDQAKFLKTNGITEPQAIAAVKRGDATIGELFELQPSIFCR